MEKISQDQWNDLASQAFFRLKEIIDLADVEDKRLLGAVKEAFDRAYGKSVENIDVKSGGEILAAPIIQYIQPKKDV